MGIAQTLIKWYWKNKRDLPWRNVSDPYCIWLSEIILQQTRVAQGLAYYDRFVETYPDIKSLANAPEEDVLKLWQGLGYYSRARNLHFTARHIVNNLNGKFPHSFESLQKLKGVGRYTAAAIASFSYNIAVPVVDGNVCRVLSRIYEIRSFVNSSSAQREFFSIAEKLIDKRDPGTFNQAIMEFGALMCTPVNPSCILCPLKNRCKAYNNYSVYLFPFKKQITQRDRFFNYLIIMNKGNIYVKQRQTKDIWENLYDFPLIESNLQISYSKLCKTENWLKFFENSTFKLIEKSDIIKHKLSHQTLHVVFYKIELQSGISAVIKNYNKVSVNNLHKLAVPVLIANYIASLQK